MGTQVQKRQPVPPPPCSCAAHTSPSSRRCSLPARAGYTSHQTSLHGSSKAQRHVATLSSSLPSPETAHTLCSSTGSSTHASRITWSRVRAHLCLLGAMASSLDRDSVRLSRDSPPAAGKCVCADGGANRLHDELPRLMPVEDPQEVRSRCALKSQQQFA
jgi:hypothetical protein